MRQLSLKEAVQCLAKQRLQEKHGHHDRKQQRASGCRAPKKDLVMSLALMGNDFLGWFMGFLDVLGQ